MTIFYGAWRPPYPGTFHKVALCDRGASNLTNGHPLPWGGHSTPSILERLTFSAIIP